MPPAKEIDGAKDRFEIPPLACDCHMHVFGPIETYPFDSGRVYTPPEAPLSAYLALRRRLGLERVVLVQPSVYGTDNRCHLDALALATGSRGVAVIAGDEPDRELERLHRCGFRGVRINLKQGCSREPIETVLARLGGRLRELNWHLQINAELAAIVALVPALARLPVPVMFDHFAGLSPWAGPSQPGFETVLGLLRDGSGWMKLSAAYHYPVGDEERGRENSRRFVSRLVEAAAGRLVWGSNWPHPGLSPKTTAKQAPIAPFRIVNDAAMLALLGDWLGDRATVCQILSDNPAEFYDF